MSAKRYEVGRYYLLPPGKYKDYGICWYDSSTRQRERVPTGETDYELAKEAIKTYALTYGDGAHADELVLQTLNRYFLGYANALPSAEAVVDTIKLVTEYWSDVKVSEIDASKQRELVTTLRVRGLADDSISRHLTNIWSALGYAVTFKHLKEKIIPVRLPRRHWGERTQPRKQKSAEATKRQLSFQELGALLDASVEMGEQALRYVILAMCTAGRPRALLEIQQAQVNLTYAVIDLNPAGRARTKKRRPIVPLGSTAAAWVASWTPGPTGHYVFWYGRPIVTRNSIRNTIRRAKIRDCNPYTLRHTISSWLAGEGVPKWERKKFMGHAKIDGGSTDDYTHYDPRYLRNAADAIERLFHAVAPYTKVNLLRQTIEDQPVPPGPEQASWMAGFLYNDGHRLVGLFEPYPPPQERPGQGTGLVVASGIEPPTTCMSSKCSTTELRDSRKTRPTAAIENRISYSLNASTSPQLLPVENSAWQLRGKPLSHLDSFQSLSFEKHHHVKECQT